MDFNQALTHWRERTEKGAERTVKFSTALPN